MRVRTTTTTTTTGRGDPEPARRDAAHRLPDGVRARLEHCLGADLSAVLVHTGPDADRLTRALRADAVTCGNHVFFRAGAYRPGTRAGLRLLAHEMAHAVQQAHGDAGARRWTVAGPDDPGERDADRAAARVLAGDAAPGRARDRVTVTARPSRLIQRHGSFEHRILGDARTTEDLVEISVNGPRRKEILTKQMELLQLWQEKPDKVTADAVRERCPWIETLEVGPGKILLTYGELGALPDYLPGALDPDALSPDLLLPILQTIRQDGYNKLADLRDGDNSVERFTDALILPSGSSQADMIFEMRNVDELTFGLGVAGTDHFLGLLARNACHFAPFSWFRWQSAYRIACNWAGLAHKDPHFAHFARLYLGYADHFLEDSFAAGHLVNKTLVMQWFIEWAAAHPLAPVADWATVKDMTTFQQPFLAGRWLYDMTTWPVNDPQTAEEAATVVRRFLDSTVVPYQDADQFTAYQNYLTFITNASAQFAASKLHDHFNAKSLWVRSTARPRPYEVWGDGTLLSGANGGTGVRATHEAAELARRSIRELMKDGRTSIGVEQIQAHLPTMAGTTADDLLNLREWNEALRPTCEELFVSWWDYYKDLLVNLGSPRLGIVSQDQRFTSVWYRRLTESPLLQPVQNLVAGGRLYSGSHGWVAELDPVTGKIVNRRLLPSKYGVGDYTTRMTTDGRTLYAGTHGYVYAVPLDDWTASAWPPCPVGEDRLRYERVDVLFAGGRLYAGCNGWVYELDPATGAVAHKLQLASVLSGSEVCLATDGRRLYAGVPGSVCALPLTGWGDAPTWRRPTRRASGYQRVEVHVAGGHLYAGADGWVYELDPASGGVVHELRLTDKPMYGDQDVTLAADGARLYAGYNGRVFGVRLAEWSGPWEHPVGDTRAGTVYARADVIVTHDGLFAGSNGYVYRLDTNTGKVRSSQLLTLQISTPGDFTCRLATDGENLFAGVHGYVYRVAVRDTWMPGTLCHDWYDGRWHQWTRNFDGAPYMRAVAGVMGPANLEVFGIGEGGNVYHNWYDGRWHGWEEHFRGAPPLQTVTGVRSGGTVHVYGLGEDGNVYHNRYDGNWWPSWQVAYAGARSVTCFSFPDGRSGAFVVDRAGTLWEGYYNEDGKWNGWTPQLNRDRPLHGLASAISKDSHVELFALGADGTLCHNWLDWSTGHWHDWVDDFDGAPKMRSVVPVVGPDNLEVFGVGMDGTLYHDWFDGRWHGWARYFDGAPPRIRTVTAVKGPRNLEVYAIDLVGDLYHNWYDGHWHGWERKFDDAPKQMTAVTGVLGRGNLEVFALTDAPLAAPGDAAGEE